MKHYKLNDKPFTCPENWQEVTLEQLLKINTGITRVMEAVSICTGIPEDEWYKATDFKLIEEIEVVLAFLNTEEGMNYNKDPQAIVFNCVEIAPFSDLGNLSIGQYQDLKAEIANFFQEDGEEIDSIRKLSIYPRVVAIYIQPKITGGEYDWEKAEQISKDLFKHPAMEVSAWGAFFILRFQELRYGIMKDVQKLTTKQKSLKPGLLNYIKTLVGKRSYMA